MVSSFSGTPTPPAWLISLHLSTITVFPIPDLAHFPHFI